jgi:MoaA/NifB/PqqE/SkfB family radical SAM enzyme
MNKNPFLPRPYNHIVLHACKYIDGLNRRCNHNCIFCFENVDLEKSNKMLPTLEMINSVFNDVCNHNKKYGVSKLDTVYIAGGEPTMRDDIFDIIQLVSNRSNTVFISSHADYENPNASIKGIKKSGITNASISLHGHNAKTHEFVTNTKGSFDNTMKSIGIYLEEGIKVSMNCVVTALNINSLLDILKILHKKTLGINDITFTQYRHSGRACEQTTLDFNSSYFSNEIKQALDFAENIPFSVKFRDFPLCLDRRLIDHNVDVASYFVIIWDDSNSKIYNLYSEQSGKTFLPMCKPCDLQKKCAGILTAALDRPDKYTSWANLDEY